MDDLDMARAYQERAIEAGIAATRQPKPLRRCDLCNELFEVDSLQPVGRAMACAHCIKELDPEGGHHGK